MLFGSRQSSQALFASKALLRLRLRIIPNPPKCFGLVTVVQLIAWIFFLDLTPKKISVDLVKLMADFCEEEGALYQVDGHCQGDGVEEHKLTRHGEGVGFPT